jgi:hypothetical protein
LTLLNTAGVRLIGDAPMVGIWSDRDCPQIRQALAALELGTLEVRYLDGPGIPDHYKLRQIAGEPVPMNVLEQMMADTRAAAAPWKIRDRMLADMKWHARPIPMK